MGSTRLLLVLALANLCGAGCSDPAVVPPDGGAPERDAPVAPGTDAPPILVDCDPAGPRTFDVDVISATGYPQPGVASPLADASVRVAHLCGMSAEGTTDATGHVTITLDGPPDGWAITAARAGYSAVSVLDLSSSPIGPLRIDRFTSRTFTPLVVSGSIAGAAAGAQILVDAYDFDTTTLTTNGPWSSTFYAGGPSGAPLLVAAFELAAGHATNFTTAEIDPRPASAANGVDLTFGAPTAPVATTFRYAGFAGATFVFANANHYFGTVDGAFVVAAHTRDDGGGSVTFEHFPALVPDAGFVTYDGSSYRTVHMPHEFPAGVVDVVPPTATSFFPSGGRTGETFAAYGVASGDIDVLAIHIDEAEDHGPRWRVYCAPSHGPSDPPCTVPRLPTGITPESLGMDPFSNALVMMQTAHEGSVWSNHALAFPSGTLDWQLATSYTNVDLRGAVLTP